MAQIVGEYVIYNPHLQFCDFLLGRLLPSNLSSFLSLSSLAISSFPHRPPDVLSFPRVNE